MHVRTRREGGLFLHSSPLLWIQSFSSTDRHSKSAHCLIVSCCYTATAVLNVPWGIQTHTVNTSSLYGWVPINRYLENNTTSQEHLTSITLKQHRMCTAVMIIDASKSTQTYFPSDGLSWIPGFELLCFFLLNLSWRAGAQVFFIWPESWLVVSCAVF